MTLPPRTTVVTLVPSASVFVIGTASADADGLAAACGAADALLLAPLLSRAEGGGGAELHAVTTVRPATASNADPRLSRRGEGLGMGPPRWGCGAGRL